MTELFTAFDITGLTTNVTTILVAGVGLTLVFLGYAKIKKTGRIF